MNSDTELPNYLSDVYVKIALNDLVTYAVYFLTQSGREITFEDVVAVCFKLFPARFHLRGYPDWPDSTVVNKRWLDCRSKNLIQGSTAAGLSLTPKGMVLAEKTLSILTGKRTSANKVSTEMRTRAGRFVRSLEGSEAFQDYSKNEKAAEISEFAFRNMLLCTMESSASTLSKNIGQFSQYASLYKRDDLFRFLEFCKIKFAHLLSEYSGEKASYRGGMAKQKIR